MADAEYSIEDYERMAAQTHPDILLLNIDYLQQIVQRAKEEVTVITDYRALLEKKLYTALGAIGASAVGTEFSYATMRELTKVPSSLDIYIIGAGIALGWLQTIRHLPVREYIAERRARGQHETLNNFHQSARTRAVEMGLPGFVGETES